MKIIHSNCGVEDHALLTTGVHGAGDNFLGLSDQEGLVLSKVVWKDASARALSDLNRTTNIDWTDLDLTARTSANAKAAILFVYMNLDSISGTAYATLYLRKNGTTPTYNPSYRLTSYQGDIANASVRQVLILGLDTGQVLEYKIGLNGTIQVDSIIDVLGYIE